MSNLARLTSRRKTKTHKEGKDHDGSSPELLVNQEQRVSRVTIIEVQKGRLPSLALGELWNYRELIYFMTWRDIKVRYKQTVLGGTWAVIQPVFMMVVFSIFFGRLAGVPSEGLPYPIFAYAALVPWTFFAAGLAQSAESLAGNSRLVTKVYFPRLVIPIATVLSNLVDLGIAFAVLLIMMILYGIAPPLQAIFIPVFLMLALITALGVGFWLSALNAKYRDIRYMVPFLLQAWLFLTPVAYPSSLLSGSWRTIYALNPMVGVVEGFRWGLLGVETAPTLLVLVSAVMALTVLVTGAFYFRKLERSFADVL